MSDFKHLHWRYNLIYPIIILVITIIVLITVEWGEIEELAKLLTFGLTLTSLFLALIAIIYSMISNASQTQNIGKLNEASSRITESADSLVNATVDLESKLESLPELFSEVDAGAVKRHEELLSQLESSVHQQPVDEPPKPVTVNKKDLVDRILDTHSILGLTGIYACQLAERSKNPLDLSELGKLLTMNPEYLYGVFVSMASVGLIAFQEKNHVWNVLRVDEDFGDLKSIVTKKSKDLFTESNFHQTFTDSIKAMEAYLE